MSNYQKVDRKLSAIMFTDMVGYSAISNSNEKLALALLEEHRTLLRKQFSQYNGKEIKTIGDAFLVDFSSSLDSINSAIAIQKSLDIYNSNKDSDSRINLRIGIHLGDIIETEDDVQGDGVNIASRIEPFSDVGGICISKQIYDQIKNKISLNIESIGEKELKNISQPLELFRVILPWKNIDNNAVGNRKVENSIAVLPFVNMSSDKENEYFSDGITEEILNVLAKEKDLKVISRTSSFAYKGKDVPIRQIGRELGVETVLEGSVRKSGQKVRITTQLIRVNDDFHMWSNTYDRTLEDIFAVQDEIASTILSELLQKLITIQSDPKLENNKNIEAYNLYLQGRHEQNKRTKKGLLKAIEFFEKSLKIDSTFSLAHCGISDSWCILVFHANMDTAEVLPKCKSAIRAAEKIGIESAELFTSTAAIFYLEDKKNKSIEYLNKAIELNPNYATAHHWLSTHYLDIGNVEKSIKEINKASILDPLSPIIQYAAAIAYEKKKEYKLSLQLFKKTEELSPGFKNCKLMIAHLYTLEYNWDKALNSLEKIKNKKNAGMEENQYLFYLQYLINLYLTLNKREKAKQTIDKFNSLDKLNAEYYYVLGDSFYYLKDFKKSYKFFNKYCELKPEDAKGFQNLAQPCIELEEYDEAFQALNKSDQLFKNTNDENGLFWNIWARGYYSIKRNDIETAYLTIHNIKNYKNKELKNEYAICQLYFMIGDIDKGYEWYQKHSNKYNHNPKIIYDIAFDNFRKDSRYKDILNEMKILEYWD